MRPSSGRAHRVQRESAKAMVNVAAIAGTSRCSAGRTSGPSSSGSSTRRTVGRGGVTPAIRPDASAQPSAGGGEVNGTQLTGRFLQYYRENANWLERTYDFVPRIGLDRLKDVLFDDVEGICAELDAGIQRSVDAYTDPWGQDAKQPATPGQFRPSLLLIALPKVPVR
jgi:hypothetical protein